MEWSTFWAAVSAISTILTVLIAAWAILRWKKQDELKAKLAFKMAIANYSFLLTQMPNNLGTPHVMHASIHNIKRLNELLSVCYNTWLICEGLLDDKGEVNVFWDFIFNNNKYFLNGEVDSSKLGACCMGILHEKFIFK